MAWYRDTTLGYNPSGLIGFPTPLLSSPCASYLAPYERIGVNPNLPWGGTTPFSCELNSFSWDSATNMASGFYYLSKGVKWMFQSARVLDVPVSSNNKLMLPRTAQFLQNCIDRAMSTVPFSL